jgi:opacity protein-like surface antigen
VLPTTVLAQNTYWGGGVGLLEYSSNDVDADFDVNSIYGRVGKFYNETFSAEFRLGLGGDDSQSNVLFYGYGTADSVKVELENFWGAYLRAGFAASDSIYPYALIGYTRGKMKARGCAGGDCISASDSENDTSLGAGVDWRLSDTTTLNFEYINYFDKDDAEVDGFNISLAKDF